MVWTGSHVCWLQIGIDLEKSAKVTEPERRTMQSQYTYCTVNWPEKNTLLSDVELVLLFSRSRSFPRWHHGREGWIFTSFATVKLRCVNLHAFTRFSHVRLWIFTFFTFSPSIGCEFSCFSRSRVWNHFTSFAIFTSPGANFHVFTFAGVDICDFYVHRCQFSMASRFSRCRAWDFTLFAIFTFLGVDSVFSRFHGLKPIFEAKSLF